MEKVNFAISIFPFTLKMANFEGKHTFASIVKNGLNLPSFLLIKYAFQLSEVCSRCFYEDMESWIT